MGNLGPSLELALGPADNHRSMAAKDADYTDFN